MSHTQEPWRKGKQGGTIVADHPVRTVEGADDIEYYGGHLIAESIAPQNLDVIKAAPKMLATCRFVKQWFLNLEHGLDEDDPLRQARERYHAPVHAALDAAIAEAEGKQ